MHKCKQQYHINSVQVTDEGLYAGFAIQGAFVKIHPDEEVLIASPELKPCHNAQFDPEGNFILINDTQHYSLQIYDRDFAHVRTIDFRQLALPIDFTRRTLYGDNHEIKAGWLRGLAFSSVKRGVAFCGLSPTCLVAINYLTGELVDFLKLQKNIWVTVHGLHNLSLNINY